MSQRVIELLLSQRKSWVDVEPGKRVQIIRPPESEVFNFIRTDGPTRTLHCTLAQVTQYTTGWDGITEADLLGAAVGASSPIAFDSALWAVVIADRAQWVNKLSDALVDAIAKHFKQKAQAEKNSLTYSTTEPESSTKAS